MLNYHIIHSQPSTTSTAEFNHFLMLGSHQTVINLDPLLSFSIVNLYKGTKLYVDQEKMLPGTFSAALNLGKYVRINGNVCQKGCVVGEVKVIEENEESQNEITKQEVCKENATILYFVLRGERSFQDKMITDEALTITKQLWIKNINLGKEKKLQVNKRTLVLIASGELRIQSTGQRISEGECIYTKTGCGDVTALENSHLIFIAFL